ncbi:MAG: hypothetical protein ABJC62_03680 [Frankiaceae bacterium]
MHTWDLAAMLDGMLPKDEALRSSGRYGPRVEVQAPTAAARARPGF